MRGKVKYNCSACTVSRVAHAGSKPEPFPGRGCVSALSAIYKR